MNRLRKAVEQNNGQTLLGAALCFYDPVFLEVAAHLGFQVIWIEMEHASITFAEAADLCRMAAGSGMLTMIRVPDSRRENILKAADLCHMAAGSGMLTMIRVPDSRREN